MKATDKEALRQQMLLRALWGDARPGVVIGWLRDGARADRGLASYRANAAALAERALAAAYPTIQELLGEDSFASLARACWLRQPPQAGDIGLWGGALGDFIADAESLANEPYLADVARLEWAVHLAERAADGVSAPQGLEWLASVEPQNLRMSLREGAAVIESTHPIVAIWQAHRSSKADRFAPVRAAFASGLAETAWVTRRGWKADVRAIDAAQARFVAALLAGQSLARALDAGGEAFDFESWLIAALRESSIQAVEPLDRKEGR